MLRPLRPDEVEYSIEVLSEDIPIRGNASAIDEETDAQVESHIRQELANGNDWAWCVVRVTAKWGDYEGHAFLGGCSYRDEREFTHPDGYYPQMQAEALDDLNSVIAKHANAVAPLLV